MPNTVSATTLADLLGVSTRTIRDLKTRGILVRAGKNFALVPSVQRYCACLRELATGRGDEAAISTATAERAQLAREQADRVALKNARARRELIARSGRR